MKKFFTDRIAELNAVTWPTQSQAIHSTATVLTIMLIVGFLLTVMDAGLSQAVTNFILNI